VVASSLTDWRDDILGNWPVVPLRA
jgi:hypothetical protein